jgi:hypothetical protein
MKEIGWYTPAEKPGMHLSFDSHFSESVGHQPSFRTYHNRLISGAINTMQKIEQLSLAA